MLALDATEDEATAASGSLALGELLLVLDAPKHAKPRLGRAVSHYVAVGDRAAAARARLSLARALVALDDPMGKEILAALRVEAEESGEPLLRDAVAAAFREAEKLFDTPRTVHTGYGRPVTVPPPKDR